MPEKKVGPGVGYSRGGVFAGCGGGVVAVTVVASAVVDVVVVVVVVVDTIVDALFLLEKVNTSNYIKQ